MQILLCAMLLVLVGSCIKENPAPIWNPNAEPPVSLPVEQSEVCDSLVEITEPAFITGYIEITENLTTSRELVVGNFRDTIHPDNSDELGVRLDSLLELFAPQYDYQVYAYIWDNRRVAIIVPGTNDHRANNPWKIGSKDWKEVITRDGVSGWINLKVYIRANDRKYYFVWNQQGFYFGGALMADEYLSVAIQFPSVASLNFRNTDYDSLEYESINQEIYGPPTKKGRRRVDLRDAITSQETIDAYFCREWQDIYHN